MSREILNNIISDFQVEKFIRFFREKNRSFAPRTEDLSHYNDDNFSSGTKLGEISFAQDERLLICAFEVTQPLTERSGKKAQYEKGKRILKDANADSGVFIFYDGNGSFRFSLIYPEYTGTKRQWSYFKRFTYFVSPELTNKTFLQQIGEGNFSSLQKIKEAFSVDPVTKQFYNELQAWYFWAMDKIKFPDDYKYSSDTAKDKEIRNATNLIRLITRIIFIWFLTEKGLISSQLFSREQLGDIVKDFMKGKKASNFYNAILQNLFFGTLNQKMNERKFADDKGYPANKKEYGVKNLYRYADKFLISKNEVLKLFEEIPFLNGGLFDCLDKEDESGKVIYIDGFSRNPAKQAIIPDYLFFQQAEERVDLSDYGLGRSRPVRGLIEILNSYNFTIDENTPVDQEIALDPELLGKVFENLLASYNPETATTARKATGSYYTPREIVDYMVTESLVAYLENTINDSARLRQLLSYSDEIPEFSDEETQKIISAIDKIKILDPACGSGAFPMGILHKLVHALQKLDPKNKYWHELQYQKALKETEEAFKLGDKNQREERLKEINEAFDEGINYPDYARKLYLIENCIYGVDIQPIAIQISKLRFFISLVLDQKVDRGKENLGIRALPNLETKFVAANTLIGLDRPQQLALRNPDIEKKENELKALRHKYFTANTRREKLQYQEQDKKLREEIAKLLINDGWKDTVAKQIAAFDLYDQNASADFFDPEWMFGITSPQSPPCQGGEAECKGGFDIVIGNPPYVQIQSFSGKPEQKAWEQQKYATYVKTGDIYCLFYERGFDLLAQNGVLTYITSNKWMRAKYGKTMRRFFLEQGQIMQLIDFGDSPIFENATTYTNILILSRHRRGQLMRVWDLSQAYTNYSSLEELLAKKEGYEPLFNEDAFVIAGGVQASIKKRIEEISVPLKNWDVAIYRGILTGFNEAFIISSTKKDELIAKDPRSVEIIKPILRGRDIKRYRADFGNLWLINSHNGYGDVPRINIPKDYPAIWAHLQRINEETNGGLENRQDQGSHWSNLRNCAYIPEIEKEKIIYAEIVYDSAFYYDINSYYPEATAFIMVGESLKYLTALLNSKLLTYAFKTFYAGGDLRGNTFRYKKAFLENLPIPKIDFAAQRPFEILVDQILAAKKKDPNADTSALERQIDEMVYNLYGLTEDEIAIVEGKG